MLCDQSMDLLRILVATRWLGLISPKQNLKQAPEWKSTKQAPYDDGR